MYIIYLSVDAKYFQAHSHRVGNDHGYAYSINKIMPQIIFMFCQEAMRHSFEFYSCIQLVKKCRIVNSLRKKQTLAVTWACEVWACEKFSGWKLTIHNQCPYWEQSILTFMPAKVFYSISKKPALQSRNSIKSPNYIRQE